MTRRTLLNYEKWALIPLPMRGGGGPGGRWTDYPEETVAEAYAAWALMSGDYGEIAPIFGISPRLRPGAISLIRDHTRKKQDAIQRIEASNELNQEDLDKGYIDFDLAYLQLMKETLKTTRTYNIYLLEAFSAIWIELVAKAANLKSEEVRVHG
jgi:hypothetical protein